MFGKHNCATCSEVENCTLKGVLDFLKDKEHREEVGRFSEDCQKVLALISTSNGKIALVAAVMPDALDEILTQVAVYAYCKGRTYQPIPSAFKEA